MATDVVVSPQLSLDVEGLGDIYLHGYMPKLETPGQLVNFLVQQRGHRLASPTILRQIRNDYVDAVRAFVAENHIPVARLEREASGGGVSAAPRKNPPSPTGVILAGVRQEAASVFLAEEASIGRTGRFDFCRREIWTDHIHFYLHDEQFGPALIKVCTEAPFAIKVGLNGQAWVRQQLRNRGIPFQTLDGCFLSCSEAQVLRDLCDQLGATQIQDFLNRWLVRLPLPLDESRRPGRYAYHLAIRRTGIVHTRAFSAPVSEWSAHTEMLRASPHPWREGLHLAFGRNLHSYAPELLQTQIAEEETSVLLARYVSCQIKQYLQKGRVLRTETVINDPRGLGVGRNISHLPQLWQLGRETNRSLLALWDQSTNRMPQVEAIDVEPPILWDGTSPA